MYICCPHAPMHIYTYIPTSTGTQTKRRSLRNLQTFLLLTVLVGSWGSWVSRVSWQAESCGDDDDGLGEPRTHVA